MRTSLLILLALACVPVASAAGPWLGTASNGVAEYTANVHGTTTMVGDGSQTISLKGKWGLPRVTLNGGVGSDSMTGGAGNLIGYLSTGWWFAACARPAGTQWPIFWSGLAAAVAVVLIYFLKSYGGKGVQRE